MMDESVLKTLKQVLESFMPENLPTAPDDLYDETELKISISALSSSISPMGSISEGNLAQKVPRASFHPGNLLSENLFHIRNLETGQEIHIDRSEAGFFTILNNLISAEQYPEALAHITLQKQKMNENLIQAAYNNDSELCKILIDKKVYGEIAAESNTKDQNGDTVLHISSRRGFLKVCEVILDYGYMTDLDVIDNDGRTPLHIAAIECQLPIAQFLVRSGANLNALDALRNTPMHYAMDKGDLEFLSWLIFRNPDLSIKNSEGKTPLEMNLKINIQEIVGNNRMPPPVVDNSPQHIQIITTLDEEANNILTPNRSFNNLCVEEAKDPRKISPKDFEAIQLLGKGSFGEVYLVEMKQTKQYYAMKILMKSKIMGQNLIKYAMTERNVLSYIKHPFIVGLKFAFQTATKLFLILDYCAGGSMASQILKEKRFTETRARIYLCEILLAIEELHKRDIIYRDLKPDNVVLDEEGHAFLTDFGLSKEGIADNHSAKSFCGSVAYLAPEMLRRQGHGKSVDWYLFGVLFYEMIVGFPPYFSTSRELMFSNIQKGKLKIPTTLSGDARSLLKELLNRDPGKRLGSRRDAEEVKGHPFFYGVNWDVVMGKGLRPPRPHLVQIVPGSVAQDKISSGNSHVESDLHVSGWTFISK